MPTNREVIEEAHYQAGLEAIARQHEKILNGTPHDRGLIKEVEELKNWRLETKTTQRVLTMVFSVLLSLCTAAAGAVAFAVDRLATAVLNRPTVIQAPPVRP